MLDLLATFTLLASGIVANKYLLRFISPDLLVGVRMTVSGLLILGASYRSPRLRWRYLRTDAPLLLFIALCTTLFPALLKAYALTAMPASKQTLLGSIDPFITALYSYLLFGERITLRKVIGMCIGFCGIGIAISSSLPAEQQWGEWLYLSLPEGAILLAVALGRYGWMLLQILLRNDRYRPHEVTALSMFVSGLCALSLMLVRRSYTSLWIELSWPLLGTFAYTVFIGNVVGYTAYSYCLRHHSATLIAMVGMAMPLLVAGIGLCFGLEVISWQFCVATAVVSLGMVIFYSDHQKLSPAAEKMVETESSVNP